MIPQFTGEFLGELSLYGKNAPVLFWVVFQPQKINLMLHLRQFQPWCHFRKPSASMEVICHLCMGHILKSPSVRSGDGCQQIFRPHAPHARGRASPLLREPGPERSLQDGHAVLVPLLDVWCVYVFLFLDLFACLIACLSALFVCLFVFIVCLVACVVSLFV